jgi:hypothetical protein
MRLKTALLMLSLSLAMSSNASAASEQPHAASLSSVKEAAITQISLQTLQPHALDAGVQPNNVETSEPSLFARASTDTLGSSQPSRLLMMLVAFFLVSYQLRRKHRSLKLQHIAGF